MGGKASTWAPLPFGTVLAGILSVTSCAATAFSIAYFTGQGTTCKDVKAMLWILAVAQLFIIQQGLSPYITEAIVYAPARPAVLGFVLKIAPPVAVKALGFLTQDFLRAEPSRWFPIHGAFHCMNSLVCSAFVATALSWWTVLTFVATEMLTNALALLEIVTGHST